MKHNIFDRLKYFTRTEGRTPPNSAWGNPDNMAGTILMILDNIRDLTEWPMVINYGTNGKHTPGSRHCMFGKSDAADWHFVNPVSIDGTPIDFYRQVVTVNSILEDLQVSNFVGLGIYPDWKKPGFHLDARGFKARWGARYTDVNGIMVQKYFSYEDIFNYIKVASIGG